MKSVQLRGWQKEAFDLYQKHLAANERSALWEATPGAGKTTAALQVIRHQLETKRARHALVVVPTSHLRIQWARSAAQVGIQLDAALGGKRNSITSDFHGAVVTYQQISAEPRLFAGIAHSAVVVLDEVHHAGDGLAWGESIKGALDRAHYVLCLSGTAFRSDNSAIPFVKYDKDGMSTPDYTYSYSQAVDDKVCRPTAVFTYGGSVAWAEQDRTYEAAFSDSLDPIASARRLRAALDPASGWIQPMLLDAHKMLLNIRREHPKAGALIACSDQEHARRIAQEIYQLCGERPTVVLSDDSTASKKIKEFSDSAAHWIVACNMVSEGVDIPRLRVGVYATNTRTKLYFRQFVGRIVRRQSNIAGLQVAYLYVPADPTLHRLAEELETECRHSLAKQQVALFGEDRDDSRERAEPNSKPWTALHSQNSGVDAVIVQGNQLSLFSYVNGYEELKAAVDHEVEVHIEDRLTRTESKQQIAVEIKRLVGLLHHRTGKPHSQIHTILNRAQHVKSQVYCTEAQLSERLRLVQNMLDSSESGTKSYRPSRPPVALAKGS
jgi:superfamily II DNA or RNA helicase